MQTVLAAIDGSEPSRRAADLAAEIAGKTGARLLLLNVVEPIWVPVGDFGQETPALQQQLERESRQLVDGEAARLAKEGLPVEALSLPGAPALAIADTAQLRKVDLVVLGTHGRRAVQRLLLGSVADRVVHICERPTLVVR